MPVIPLVIATMRNGNDYQILVSKTQDAMVLMRHALVIFRERGLSHISSKFCSARLGGAGEATAAITAWRSLWLSPSPLKPSMER
jgi:hypothetical protein